MDNDHKLYKTAPMQQQVEALRRLKGKQAYALFMEQGTGKTWCILNWAAQLWADGKIEAVLVFAPNGVQDQWIDDQIPAHMPDWCDYVARSWSATMGKKQTQDFDRFMHSETRALKILTINWEALGHKRMLAVIDEFLKLHPRCMGVADESDMIKNPAAKRTKALLWRRRLFSHRVILSGTPAAQSPFDMWAPMNWLDPSILGHSFVTFKATYAQMVDATDPLMFAIRSKIGTRYLPQIVAKDDHGRPMYRNLDRLQQIVSAHSYRVLKADCLDLPDKVYCRRYVELSGKQRLIYNEAVATLRIEWERADGNPAMSIATKLTILGRLQQIVGGFTPDAMPIHADPGDNPKLAALVETVLLQPNAIIWAHYVAEIEMLVDVLSEYGEVVAYYGDVARGQRRKAVADFRTGEARFFVGNQQAGGVGLNLAVSSFMHYFSNAFPLRTRLQSEDRAHRHGMPDAKLTLYDYEAKGTIDRKIINTLRNRLSIADAVMGDTRPDGWLNEI